MYRLIRLKNPSSFRKKISLVLAVAILMQIMLIKPILRAAIAAGGETIPAVTVTIDKTVEGVPIKSALSGEVFDLVQTGMNFELYEVASANSGLEGLSPIDNVGLNANGEIIFTFTKSGWYAIKEVLAGDAAITFAEVDPLYIYIGPSGIMSSLGENNVNGDYSVSWQPGFTKGLQLIYEYEGTEHVISGVKPDGSGQLFSTERFTTQMPDGTIIDSYCADLGAHNIWGNYLFDSTNHSFSDGEMYYIIAAFDYINDLYRDGSGQPNGLSRVEGKILAQVVLWNLILKVDKNAGFAESWIPDGARVLRIEGTSDWYEDWSVVTHEGSKTFKQIAEDIINNVSKYVGIYTDKVADPDLADRYVTGAIFIKGDLVGYSEIDQQRQLLVLFGNSVEFDNRPVYDVALCKWVSKVNGTPVNATPAVPNVLVPEVSPGDKVTFTIEVYNQTYNPTWVTQLVDYFPAGYVFDPADNPDWAVTDTPWWMSGLTTLSYNGPAIHLAPMGSSGDSKFVTVVLTVKADETDYRNAAEVLEIRDDKNGGPGKVVEDVDSTFNDEMRRHWNRQAEKDNVIDENGKGGGDKDDYDFAEVILALEKIGVNVIKNWEDGRNAAGFRPSSITLNLYQWYYSVIPPDLADLEPIRSATVTGSATGDTWEYAFLDLPISDSGGTFVYAVGEDNIIGYTGLGDRRADGVWEITNKLTATPTIDITVKKEWVDVNEESNRPTSVTVTLLQNGDPYDAAPYDVPVEIKADGDWSYTFAGLPKFDEYYVEYEYSITEGTVTSYRTPDIVDEGNGSITIINAFDYSQVKTSVNGTKTWEDNGNYYNTQPASGEVTVRLYQNGTEIRNTTTVGRNYSFTGLSMYDATGNLYIYTITEDPIPGYETTYQKTAAGYNITNKLVFVESVTNINVQKVWNPVHIAPPGPVTVELYKNSAPTGLTIILNAGNGWYDEFTGLEMFEDNNPDNPPHIYTVQETAIPGYSSSVEIGEPFSSGEGGHEETVEITITNTLLPGTTEVSITKLWVDGNNADNTRPASISLQLYQGETPYGLPRIVTDDRTADEWTIKFTGLPKYNVADGFAEYVYTVREISAVSSLYESSISSDGLTIVNTLKPGTTEISGRKIWNNNGLDPSSEDFPARPESIMVQLYQNDTPFGEPRLVEGAEWAYAFTELPKYDSTGHRFAYSVDEVETPPGYNKSIEGYNIINSVANGMKINISAEKAWNDRNNSYSTRPGSIDIILYRNNIEQARHSVSASNNWRYTFTGLDKYDASFRPYNYTVDEVLPANYSRAVAGNTKEGFVITNTLLPGTTSLSGRKVWVDGGLGAGERPDDAEADAVRIQLQQDGSDYGAPISISSYTRDYIFSNLPKYSSVDQHEYVYTVRELLNSRVAGLYSIDYSQDADGRRIVINTLGIEIRGTKVWTDRSNAGGSRPASIEVVLLRRYSAGDVEHAWEEYRSLTVTGGMTAASWNWSFGNVPKYYLVDPVTRNPIDPDSRTPNPETEPYEYMIKEIVVPGYDTAITGSIETGFTITNTSTAPPPPVIPPVEPDDDTPPPVIPPVEPDDPEDPTEQEDSEDPEDPEIPENPDDPGEPGGRNRERPPNPTVLGNTLVPGDDGSFIEFDEDGTPLGEWRWDDDDEMWIFEEYLPLGNLPQTGDAGNLLIWLIFIGCLLLGFCVIVGLKVIRKRKGAGD